MTFISPHSIDIPEPELITCTDSVLPVLFVPQRNPSLQLNNTGGSNYSIQNQFQVSSYQKNIPPDKHQK